jgi:hypothetical protein
MKDKNVTFMILFRYIKYMLKNPFVNALLAGGYIVGGVLVMSKIIEGISGVEDTIIIPMVMLSLLVLSVAVMGGLFFFEPIRLLLENKSYEAFMLNFIYSSDNGVASAGQSKVKKELFLELIKQDGFKIALGARRGGFTRRRTSGYVDELTGTHIKADEVILEAVYFITSYIIPSSPSQLSSSPLAPDAQTYMAPPHLDAPQDNSSHHL